MINNIDNENEGVIGGTGDSYGIDNTGKIEQITNGLSSSSLSKATIQGTTYGIENEAGGQIGNESGEDGIDNYGTISEIDDAGVIESSIGSSAIDNVKGVINTIKVEQGGSITSDTVGINNYGTISEIDDAGTIKTSSTTGAVTIPIANASGSTINTIIVEKGGVVTGTDGIANSGMIGTSATTNGDTTATETYGIENSGTISGIENGEGGVIGGTGDTYGIDNTGTIEAINTNSSSVIKGNEAGIYNETGGVLVGTGITGTGTTEGNYGIENAGTIADILSIEKGETIKGTTNAIYNTGAIYGISTKSGAVLSSLDNAGTIGLTGSGKSEEESAYGIDNVGTINEITNEGEIEGSTNSINNESGGQIGTSSTTGIKNTGEIQTIENAGTIGMTGGIGIEDATGEITTISNVKGGEIEGTGIKNESGSKGIKTITNEGAVSSIENEGTIGGSGNYGIDNAGDIGQINDGGSSSLEGTIEGTEAGINNESGGSLSLGAQKAIEGTGSSNATSKEYGIENAGTITNLNIVEGESIKGETTGIYNEKTITTLTNEGTSGDIDNAGTIGTLENEGGGQIGTITNEKGDTIKELTNEGTIGGGNYGIDNAGDIGQINDGGSSSLEGTIEGTEAGINNESGGSLSLGAQKAIEGTGKDDKQT